MNVNYYLDAPHNEAGHIGGSSGDRFVAKAPEGVNSFADWAAMLEGHRIFAEHGIEHTADEIVAMVQVRPRFASHRRPDPARGEFMERGVLFVRHAFH
jgi:hypothetical protein